MTDTDEATERLELSRRVAAIGALALAAAAAVIGAIGLVGDVRRLIVVVVLPIVLAAAAWIAATRKGWIRLVAGGAAVAILVLLAAVVLTAEDQGLGLVVVVVLLAGSAFLARYALRRNAAALKAQGAKGVVAYVTHGVLSGGAAARVAASELTELVVTDSIYAGEMDLPGTKIRRLTIAPLLAEAVRRIADESSVSSLFD